MRTIFGLFLALSVWINASSGLADFVPLEADPKVVNFGIISTESTINLKSQWKPFLSDMEQALGLEVQAFFAPDYAGIIEAMRFGKVHVAWFGNKSAIEAVDRAGAEVFAKEKKATGAVGYYSHLLTHASNTEINSLDDVLRCNGSLSFGIGDPNSTSGFLVPSYFVFALNQVEPKACFKALRNANHEANLMAVANRQVDVATSNSEMLVRAKAKRPEVFKNVKVIWTSPLIPSNPIVYRRDLTPEMKAKIKGFFVNYGREGTPEHIEKAKAILANMSDGLGPFADSNDTQLIPTRQLVLFRDYIRVKNDETLSDQDKAARLAVIQEKLASVNLSATPE